MVMVIDERHEEKKINDGVDQRGSIANDRYRFFCEWLMVITMVW